MLQSQLVRQESVHGFRVARWSRKLPIMQLLKLYMTKILVFEICHQLGYFTFVLQPLLQQCITYLLAVQAMIMGLGVRCCKYL